MQRKTGQKYFRHSTLISNLDTWHLDDLKYEYCVTDCRWRISWFSTVMRGDLDL